MLHRCSTKCRLATVRTDGRTCDHYDEPLLNTTTLADVGVAFVQGIQYYKRLYFTLVCATYSYDDFGLSQNYVVLVNGEIDHTYKIN